MQLDAPWYLSIGLDQERGSPRLSSQLSQRFRCCSLFGLFVHVLVLSHCCITDMNACTSVGASLGPDLEMHALSSPRGLLFVGVPKAALGVVKNPSE